VIRKKIFFLLTLLFLSFSGSAQIALNGVAGFNVSVLKTNGVDWVSESGFGYQGGATTTIGNYFYVEPGIFYIANYADLIFVGNNNGITHGITYQYHSSSLKIPVLAGYHLIGNAENSFYDLRFFVGPSVSFLLSADAVGGIQESEFSKVNWGLDAGVGFSVWIFYCNLGYEWGLNKTYESLKGGNAKSELFWVNVGVRFRL
jgi:hypothetical protein